MDKHTDKSVEQVDRKVYVEPQLEKAQKLQDVTQGEAPVVTGAPVG